MKSGDVVLLNFPFSDLSGSKLRPAVVVAEVGREDLIACQVTSNADADAAAVRLTTRDFSAGDLRVVSYVRPGKLFTAHRSIVARRVACVSTDIQDKIRDAVIAIIRRGRASE